MKASCFITRLTVVATLLCGVMTVNGQTNTRAEAEITAIMANYQAIGASVAVVKDGQIIYNQSFGLKDVESSEPLENDDLFRIASISKSFVTTGIMQLVEAGKLSLDDDVSDLIGFRVRNPNFPDSVITLQLILSHRSSLSDQNGYFTLDVLDPDKNKEWTKSYNSYAPNAGYQYCNLNFNLAGAILEKYAGQRFDQYISTHILEPLGVYGGYNVDVLDRSKFVTLYAYDSDAKHFVPSPEAYAPRAEALKTYKQGYSAPIFSPTGGMKISSTDLARVMIMHMNHGKANGTQIISEASSRAMQTVRTPESGYGMSLRTIDYLIPGKKMTGHEGIAYGLYSAMYFQPEEKFGIVVITNGCNTAFSHNDVINDFLLEVYGSLYKHFLQ